MDREIIELDEQPPEPRPGHEADNALAWVIAAAAIIATVLINYFTQ